MRRQEEVEAVLTSVVPKVQVHRKQQEQVKESLERRQQGQGSWKQETQIC